MEVSMEKKILLSNETDPYWNQAMEKKLFDQVTEDEVFLFLYVNQPCVVIGRNQNPWQEVEIESLKSRDIKLIRRISGGGTVYHDLGNLNFSVIKQMEVIINAGKRLGINLHITSRKDIFSEDKKVSGNAFYNRGLKSMHHGTLLIDLDKKDLWKILKFDHQAYRSKSIVSVRSPVINLSDINSKITIDAYVKAIICEFNGEMVKDFKAFDKKNYSHFKSWDWLYGETPNFYYEKDENVHLIKKGINTLTEKVFCP
jgi:lipoate-protein ligase A